MIRGVLNYLIFYNNVSELKSITDRTVLQFQLILGGGLKCKS